LIKTEKLPEYVVVYYIEPVQGNESALGYTINTQRNRIDAINKAFASGVLTVSAGIKLVQQPFDSQGVLFLLPL
jgi:CHASE1-domain containing sensor protein